MSLRMLENGVTFLDLALADQPQVAGAEDDTIAAARFAISACNARQSSFGTSRPW